MDQIKASSLTDAVNAPGRLNDGDSALVFRALSEISPAGAEPIVRGDPSGLHYSDRTIYEAMLQSAPQRQALACLALPHEALEALSSLLTGSSQTLEERRTLVRQAAKRTRGQ